MSAITFAGVTKRYGGFAAVDGAAFTIEDGTWCVVTGRNGSGKTTLLQLASALQEPTVGEVTVGGARAGTPEARRQVAYLDDAPAFFSDLSVREHVEYVAGLFGDASVIERAEDVLARFALSGRSDDLPDSFSRGMKQKAAIALALARPSSVLLLDEPTRGLDEEGASALVEVLSERHRRGATIVTVTHEPARFARSDAMRVRMTDGAVTVD